MKIQYNNLYIHYIFSTLHKLPVISDTQRERIEKYITGIIKNNESHLYAIYANPDHMHFLVSISPRISEEKLASIVADNSERFINENKLVQGIFKWQDSCSAFSVSKRDISKVCRYIERQPIHHRKMSFKEESDIFIKFYEKTIDITKEGN
jgi:REP element-mobilizing transposase RayT